MGDIICTTPDCNAIIADPCERVVALFSMKVKLLDDPNGGMALASKLSLHEIDEELENQLGLKDHEAHFNKFKKSLGFNLTSSEKIFTITCIKEHQNQYKINCP